MEEMPLGCDVTSVLDDVIVVPDDIMSDDATHTPDLETGCDTDIVDTLGAITDITGGDVVDTYDVICVVDDVTVTTGEVVEDPDRAIADVNDGVFSTVFVVAVCFVTCSFAK